MSSFFDLVSYQTATGLLDENIPLDEDQYYILRKTLIETVQNQAWAATAPFDAWLSANRVFFTLSAPLTYTIGNKNFSLLAATIYSMDPKEVDFVTRKATELGITYTPSTLGAWQGVGSLDTFYW